MREGKHFFVTAHKSAVLGIAVILVSTGIQAKAAVEFPERYENENENVIFDLNYSRLCRKSGCKPYSYCI